MCWGKNGFGQLGDNSQVDKVNPTAVSEIYSATSVACGVCHTCASLTNGTVMCWGNNSQKQLGLDNGLINVPTAPTAVPDISDVTSVAANSYHTCALLTDGTITCWGYNANGQIGVGSSENLITTPTAVSGITTATSLTLGKQHTCALLSNGGVMCWGMNDYGQLGDGTNTNRLTPTPVSGIDSATSVGAGDTHTCAVLRSGGVKCWGNNEMYQLGDSNTNNRHSHLTPTIVPQINSATSVGAGESHTCALLKDGGVMCWGNNYEGALGNAVVAYFSKIPVAAFDLTSATSLSSGDWHMCAGLKDGSVRCWGNNEHGQLGDGTTTNKDTPTAVSTVAIGANCAVTNPVNGNAGVGSDSCGGKTTLNVGESCAPRCDAGYTVSGVTTCSAAGDISVATCAPLDVASGGDHSCASASFGEVTSCGLNDCDRLGNGEIDGSDVKRA